MLLARSIPAHVVSTTGDRAAAVQTVSPTGVTRSVRVNSDVDAAQKPDNMQREFFPAEDMLPVHQSLTT